MSFVPRRAVLFSAAAFVALPLIGEAREGRGRRGDSEESEGGGQAKRIPLKGDVTQGGLVTGNAGDGSEVWVDDQPVRVTKGTFCFGFSRDAKPVAVRIRRGGKTETTEIVTPKTRKFQIQRIDGLPEKYVSPPKEILERIARDAKAVAEARSHDREDMWFMEKFDWPANGPITGVYGSQRILNGEPREAHYGLDIAEKAGSPIKAPLPGVVALAEELFLSGNTMIIDHGHGVSTSYLHMSHMDAKVGDRLKRGQPIGLVGQTGRATGPHLCWRLNWFQTRLDVALVVPPRPGDKA